MSQPNDTGASGGQQGGGQQGGGQQPDQQAAQQEPDQQGPNGERARNGQQGTGRQGGGFTEWFANSALRIGIVLVGFTLFLFALGQAVGLELLGMFVDAVTSQTGRWLVVAGFALLLILVGQQGVKQSSWTD